MPYERISAAEKQGIYDAFKEGEDYVEVARTLGIKRDTAYRIIRRAETRAGVVSVARGGHRRRLATDETRDTAIEIVQEHPKFTLDQINAELRLRLPSAPHFSRSTLSNMLTGNLIILKKFEDAMAERVADRDCDEAKRLREEFGIWMMSTGVNMELIYIDEVRFNLWTKRSRGSASHGVRVVAGRRPYLTMTFAVSNRRGLVHHDLIQGYLDGGKFINFLERVPYVPGQNTCMLFDNSGAHGRAHEANLPEDFEVKIIPPGSPFRNMICFSTWKAAVKRELADVREDLLLQTHQERMATLAHIAEEVVNVITPTFIEPEHLSENATLISRGSETE